MLPSILLTLLCFYSFLSTTTVLCIQLTTMNHTIPESRYKICCSALLSVLCCCSRRLRIFFAFFLLATAAAAADEDDEDDEDDG